METVTIRDDVYDHTKSCPNCGSKQQFSIASIDVVKMICVDVQAVYCGNCRRMLWCKKEKDMNPMTPAEFTEAMKKCADNGDNEAAHGDADDLLCRVLTELGYGDGVKVFESMIKWYA